MKLKQLHVENFRSLRGEISVPLDSSVVLIHGQNGSGKTSLLSALELGLTGSVDSLKRIDDGYVRHLTHQGAAEAVVSVDAYFNGEEITRSVQRVRSGKIIGSSLLDSEQSRYFTDRAFLAQATLSRLLEIYEHSDAKGTSAMTRFVNELLGLDHLDAQIDGLDPALDIRRTKKLVPELDDAERRRGLLASRIVDIEADLALVRARRLDTENKLRTALAEPSGAAEDLLANARSYLLQPLGSSVNPDARSWLFELSSFRSDLSSFEAQERVVNAEVAHREAVRLVDNWREVRGREIDALMTKLTGPNGQWLPDELVGTQEKLREARRRLAGEIDVLRSANLAAAQASVAAAHLASQLGKHALELSAADNDLAASLDSADLSELQSFLASSLNHVHGDTCPVCERDYAEIGGQSLEDAISVRIQTATLAITKLTTARAHRNQLQAMIAELEAKFRIAQADVIETEILESRKNRVEMLAKLLDRIDQIEPAVGLGEQLRATVQDRWADLVSLSEQTSQSEARISRLRSIGASLGIERASQSIPEWIDLLSATLRIQIEEGEQIDSGVSHVLVLSTDLEREIGELSLLEKSLRECRVEMNTLDGAIKLTTNRMLIARSLAHSAVSVRSSILGRVFNETLNSTWRDLFTRLAPGELFTPEFMLPSAGRSKSSARLTTSHRGASSDSGSPGLMLSSGNLNTAALTLFLALNLTASPKLPWLLLDDPIQSMDDVHISQFAALLRTLNKKEGRQIVIAVHERALFEYLRLELSPAYEGDSLTTVELERKSVGSSVAVSNTVVWKEDPARVA